MLRIIIKNKLMILLKIKLYLLLFHYQAHASYNFCKIILFKYCGNLFYVKIYVTLMY